MAEHEERGRWLVVSRGGRRRRGGWWRECGGGSRGGGWGRVTETWWLEAGVRLRRGRVRCGGRGARRQDENVLDPDEQNVIG